MKKKPVYDPCELSLNFLKHSLLSFIALSFHLKNGAFFKLIDKFFLLINFDMTLFQPKKLLKNILMSIMH